ncbi:MAG: hypothetical protein HQL51_14540 [Magnetococcales bacterium]|nr:hypothetical protein [Magnetococcales bacterium]
MKRLLLVLWVGVAWSDVAWAARKPGYVDVDPKPIVRKCHDQYSPPLGNDAYAPVNDCLEKEIMNQARIMMMRSTLKDGRFEKKLKSFMQAHARLFEAIYDQCGDCAFTESRNLFVQRQVERELVRLLSRMIDNRNVFGIDKNTKEY